MPEKTFDVITHWGNTRKNHYTMNRKAKLKNKNI